MKTLELEITAEDIATDRHDGSVCPIARALGRALGCLFHLHVRQRELVFYDSHRQIHPRNMIAKVALPPELTAFIRAYDAKGLVQPFKFTWTINLPSIGL